MNRTQPEKLSEIIILLREKGYDPVAQFTGYIEMDREDYITRHGGAREKIKEIPKDVIKEYIRSQE